MRVVNLFAGPCAGKSTTAMGLSYKMKLAGKNVEYVTEYAKSLTWEKRDRVLENQLYILAKQDKKLRDLDGQVDWAVSDSPLIIGIDYAFQDIRACEKEIEEYNKTKLDN